MYIPAQAKKRSSKKKCSAEMWRKRLAWKDRERNTHTYRDKQRWENMRPEKIVGDLIPIGEEKNLV